jgi:restriction system protein
VASIQEIKLEFEDSVKTDGKYLVFDLETTGLPINRNSPPNDFNNWPYVVQISWLLFDDEHKLLEHSSYYLKQPIKIPIEAINIHGITNSIMLEKGIAASKVYANFKKVLDNTEYLIAHNLDFEIPIIHCDFLRNGMTWDFPNNKMFCTMKTGTSFCKILPFKNGEFKWPTLEELYHKCFFADSSSFKIKGLHDANIDAAITAKCFFKLKELGFFQDHGINTKTTDLFGKQDEDKFTDLHVVEYIDSFSDEPFKVKIQHLGLGTSRLLKDEFKWRLENTIKAEFKKLDERWMKISLKKKAQADKEVGLNIAQERTIDAREKQEQIENLLIHALENDITLDWNSLKNTKKFNVQNPKSKLETDLGKINQPIPPVLKDLPKEPCIEHYKPHFSLLDKVIKPLRVKAISHSELLYKKAISEWKKSYDEVYSFNTALKEQYEQKVKEYEKQVQIINERYNELEKNWAEEKKIYYNTQIKHNETIEKLKEKYFLGDPDGIIQYCRTVLNNSKYPDTFPKEFILDYAPDNKILIIEYVLPSPSELPRLREVKYIISKKDFKESFISETQLSKNYDYTVYKITLRTLYELFKADKAEAIDAIIFNGFVNAIDKATGMIINNCIVSVQVNKIEFNEINLSNVDPKTCYKYLKGIGSSKLSSMIAIQPIARINKNKDHSFFSK